VNINSGPGSPPQQGQAGSLVPPMKPKATHEADKADPGQMEEIKQQQIQQGTGKYGLIPLPVHKPAPRNQPGSPPQHWIQVQLVDESGQPVPGERYRVETPNGSVAEGSLDAKGQARIEGLEPGTCKVSFPDRDQDAWRKK
jgi:hypothetical protein